MLKRILDIWSRIESTLIGLLLLAALFIFLGGAIVRAISPAHAVDWAEELSVYCIIWATAFSGSVLVYEKRHISTEIIVATFSQPAQKILGLAMMMLTLLFCIIMGWYGYEAVDFALLLDERSASTLRVQQAWAVFLALPVGLGLMVLRLLLMLLAGERSIAGDMLMGDQQSSPPETDQEPPTKGAPNNG